MKTNRLLLAALLMAGTTQTTFAQDYLPQAPQNQTGTLQMLPPLEDDETSEDGVEATVQCDFVSHYMWRGTDMGGISIQPTVSIGWRGLSLSLFGSTGLDKEDSEEIDLTLGYERDFGEFGFNIGVTDYWTSGMDYGKLDRYFFFEEAESAHQLEANIGFRLPWFYIQGYTMVWGNDFKYQSHLDDALKSIQEAVATLQSQILIQGDEDLTTDEAYRLSECYAAIARLRYGAWMNEP